MSLRSVELNRSNFALVPHAPAIAVEYDPARAGDESTRRGKLKDATTTLFFAVDSALRVNDRAENGLPYERPSYARYEKDRKGSHNMFAISEDFAGGLFGHRNSDYTIVGNGTPDGGINQLGSHAVSQMFDNSSPQCTGNDNYWHKKTLQIVRPGNGILAVGVYGDGQDQILQAETLKSHLEENNLQRFLRRPLGVHVSGKQPVTIKDVQYVAKTNGDGDGMPNTLQLNGMEEYLFGLAKEDPNLTYNPFRQSVQGFSASALLFDSRPAINLGLRMMIAATPIDSSNPLRVVPHGDQIEVLQAGNNEYVTALDTLSISIKPVVAMLDRTGKTEWRDLRQKEVVILGDQKVAAALKFNKILSGMYRHLLNAA